MTLWMRGGFKERTKIQLREESEIGMEKGLICVSPIQNQAEQHCTPSTTT